MGHPILPFVGSGEPYKDRVPGRGGVNVDRRDGRTVRALSLEVKKFNGTFQGAITILAIRTNTINGHGRKYFGHVDLLQGKILIFWWIGETFKVLRASTILYISMG